MRQLIAFPLALTRFILFIVICALFISGFVIINSFLGRSIQRGIQQRMILANVLLPMLGVRLSIKGNPPKQPSQLVCNHRSYLDPIPLLTFIPAVPIAKSELASWPLIGYGATITGIIFLERNNKASRRQTQKVIADTIKAGYTVINYVEGTTHKQPQTIDFKRGSFIMAAEEQVFITPAALEYKEIDDAWVDDETFVPHFFKCFGKWRTKMSISFGQSIQHSDPNYLMQYAKNFIDQELLAFREEWNQS